MLLLESLQNLPPLPSPIALTIGMFDGVHAGHRHLLSELKKLGTPVVLTFRNHPLEVLQQRRPRQLCSLEEKLQHLEEAGVYCTLLLPFDRTLADKPYDLFLQEIKSVLPFTALVLGQGAAFGKDNQGDEPRVRLLQEKLAFQAHYLPLLREQGEVISSSRLRLDNACRD